ncbi:MAG: hypothetical protein ABIQ30_02535 [Devosia sp.]
MSILFAILLLLVFGLRPLGVITASIVIPGLVIGLRRAALQRQLSASSEIDKSNVVDAIKQGQAGYWLYMRRIGGTLLRVVLGVAALGTLFALSVNFAPKGVQMLLGMLIVAGMAYTILIYPFVRMIRLYWHGKPSSTD